MKFIKNILLSIMLFVGASGIAFSQQPQAPIGTPLFNANAQYTNGVAPGYWPTPGTGLNLNISAGTAYCSTGNIITYAGGSLTLTASSTNYVYLSVGSSCVPSFNTSGFISNQIPVATVITNGSAIVSIQDDRTLFSNPQASGTSISLTTTGTTGAATLIGSVLNIPQYQGAITLTTTGSSGAATLVGSTINIPNYTFSSGISGGTAGQVAIMGSASTVTSSKALAGSGAGVTTGPTTSVSGNCTQFTGVLGQVADSGAPCGSGSTGGTVTYTTSQTASSTDNGKLVVMNCAAPCSYTLPASQPSSTWFAGVTTQGANVATIVLAGGDTFNGSASVPVLNSFRIMWVYANTATATDYRGEAPIVAGTNVTFTPSSNGLNIAASGGGGALNGPVDAQTGASYTLVLSDAPNGLGTVTMNNAGVNTVTVPTNASVAFPIGAVITFAQLGAGQTTIAAAGGVTINTPTSLSARAQYSSIAVKQLATNVWIAYGDLQ